MPRISVRVSKATWERMEEHILRTGVKRGHLVEQALLHHLLAMDELPAEFAIHPRIVVSKKTGEQMLRRARTGKPTPALRKLIRDGDQGSPSERRAVASLVRTLKEEAR